MPQPIASTRDRGWAACIDSVLLAPLLLLDHWVAGSDWHPVGIVVYFLFSWQVEWVYSTLLHGWRGQTVGKAILGIRVVRYSDRGRLGWRRSFSRNAPFIALELLFSTLLVYWHGADLAGLGSAVLDTWADWLFDLLRYAGLGWLAVEFLTMVVHPERRALHDLLAGSLVIRDVPEAEPAASPVQGDE